MIAAMTGGQQLFGICFVALVVAFTVSDFIKAKYGDKKKED